MSDTLKNLAAEALETAVKDWISEACHAYFSECIDGKDETSELETGLKLVVNTYHTIKGLFEEEGLA